MAATIIPSKIDVIFQGQIYFVLNATYIGTSRPGFIYWLLSLSLLKATYATPLNSLSSYHF